MRNESSSALLESAASWEVLNDPKSFNQTSRCPQSNAVVHFASGDGLNGDRHLLVFVLKRWNYNSVQFSEVPHLSFLRIPNLPKHEVSVFQRRRHPLHDGKRSLVLSSPLPNFKPGRISFLLADSHPLDAAEVHNPSREL